MSARFDRPVPAVHWTDRLRSPRPETICRSAADPRSCCHGARHGQVLQARQGLGGHYLSRSARRLRRMGTFQRHRDGRLPFPERRRPGRVRLRARRAGQLPVRRDQRPKAVANTLHAPGREPDNIARVPSSCPGACRAAPPAADAVVSAGGPCRWPLCPVCLALLIPRRAVLARYSLLVEPASAHGRPARWTRGLLYCGLAAGPAFVTTFLAEGATRDGYRPSRHPVSSLALGPRGRVQTAHFAVTGTLVLAGAAGLGRAADPALSSRAGGALIGAAGAGLIGAAVFATDPVSGYPPGTPDALTQPS